MGEHDGYGLRFGVSDGHQASLFRWNDHSCEEEIVIEVSEVEMMMKEIDLLFTSSQMIVLSMVYVWTKTD